MSDPFENALKQLQEAAKVLGLDAAVINYLSEPKKFIEVAIPLRMDDGSIKMFKGFRSQYNDDRGPFKGGIRFHPQVSENEVRALSMWMTWKCAIADIPYGGGKGGIIVDPEKLSKGELERLSRGYIQAIYKDIGVDVDVPAPDVNTDGQIMAWMLDEYEKLTGQKAPGVITGKPIELGGSLGREAATGRGGVVTLVELAKRRSMAPAETTIAVQGFGNVGYFFALLAQERGYKIVAVSDSRGGIHNPNGLDIKDVMAHKESTGKVSGFAGTKDITNEELLALDVNVLVPAALENAINKENVMNIKAPIIIEMANGPVTPNAENDLDKRGTVVIPDVLANAGGVTVSYFEWVQNKENKSWTEEVVNQKLHDKMVEAFTLGYDKMQELKVTFRQAVYVLAIEKVVKAAREKGRIS